jgi:hypothetical protein
MKTASLNGKRLSDVVEVCWSHLQKAKHPISYLNALINGTNDFSVEAKRLRDQQHAAATEKLECERVEQRRAAIAGQQFFSRDGSARFSVSSDGLMLVEERAADTHSRSSNSAGWVRAFIEALDDGHVRPATDELDAAFAEARADAAPRRLVLTANASRELPDRKITPTVSAHLGGIAAILRAKGFAVSKASAVAE